MGSMDMTTIELPVVPRDRLRDGKMHPNQAYYELIEDAAASAGALPFPGRLASLARAGQASVRLPAKPNATQFLFLPT